MFQNTTPTLRHSNLINKFNLLLFTDIDCVYAIHETSSPHNVTMPFHLKNDRLRLRQITSGQVVVIGGNVYRNDFKSNNKVLPGKVNVIVSSTYKREIVSIDDDQDRLVAFVNSVDEALDYLQVVLATNPSLQVFVLGGPRLFEQFGDFIGKVGLTLGLFRIATASKQQLGFNDDVTLVGLKSSIAALRGADFINNVSTYPDILVLADGSKHDVLTALILIDISKLQTSVYYAGLFNAIQSTEFKDFINV